MRKGRDGEKNGEKNGEKKTGEKKTGEKKKREKTDENSGHYVVCQQSTVRNTTAGTPHARAKILTQEDILEEEGPMH